MFAVIKTGGKQYRVQPDDVLKIEKLDGEVGETVSFETVLMVGGEDDTQVGAPVLDGASVAAEVVDQGRARKVIVFKKKRRQNYRRKKGHRQHETTVRITEIMMGGKSVAKSSGVAMAAAATAAVAASTDAAATAPGELTQMFDRPDGPADDLTRINGVGPVIVEKLDKLGVTQFSQVAAWTEEDCEKVDAVLSFKGRIGRENWVEQAAELAKGE